MSTTAVGSAHYAQQWDKNLYREYIRESGFASYMQGTNNVIVPKRQLVDGGQTINVPYTPKLTGAGIRGASTLRGNEEAMQFYNEQVTVDYIRHAVEITKRDSSFVMFDLRKAAKDQMKDWFINDMRNRLIDQLLSIRASGTGANLLYGTIVIGSNGPAIAAADYVASEANKDTWLTNNADRVLFGQLRSNASSLDHSTSLGNVDTTNDKMTAAIIQLAHRMAKQSNPQIRPLRTDGGSEWYVFFLPTRAFRDAQADSTISAANRDARAREGDSFMKNPIFTGGELLYDGVIIKEIPELPVLTAAGNSSADVAPCFFCGQQAIAYALGQDLTSVEEVNDYGFRTGLGAEELSGIKKIFFNSVQNGTVTVYVAAAADS